MSLPIPNTQEELYALLHHQDIEYSIRSLAIVLKQSKKYVFSTLFYPCFPTILTRLFSNQGRNLSLVRASPTVFSALLSPSTGALFNLLFREASFPPNYNLPLDQLPKTTQIALRSSSTLQNISPGTVYSPLATLLKPFYRADRQLVELPVYHFFFFHLANYIVTQDPLQPNSSVPIRSAGTPAKNIVNHINALHLPTPPSAMFTANESHRHYLNLIKDYLEYFTPFSFAETNPKDSHQSAHTRNNYGDAFTIILAEILLGQNASQQIPLNPFLSVSNPRMQSTSNIAMNGSSMIQNKDNGSFVFPTEHQLQTLQTFLRHLFTDTCFRSAESLHRTFFATSGIDILAFKFFRSCMVRWTDEWDNRLTALFQVYSTILQAWLYRGDEKINFPIRAYVFYYLPFYTILFGDSLNLLSEVEGSREGNNNRKEMLKQTQTLFQLYVERVRSLVQEGEEIFADSAATSSVTTPIKFRSARTVTSPAAKLRTSNNNDAHLIFQQMYKFAEVQPNEYTPLFMFINSDVTKSQQLAQAVIQTLAPSSIRNGPSNSMMLKSNVSAYQSQILEEEKIWQTIERLANDLFQLENIQIRSSPQEDSLRYRSSAVRTIDLNDSRQGNGKSLKALKFANKTELKFQGGQWDRPLCTYEVALAIPIVRRLEGFVNSFAKQFDNEFDLRWMTQKSMILAFLVVVWTIYIIFRWML